MTLPVDEALEVINVPKAKFTVAVAWKDVQKAAHQFGYPLVLKLIAPKVVHKTEAGGVKVARSDADLEVAKKFLKTGKVLVQEFVEGTELFLGIKNDPSFGHVLLAGIGGIYVEVYKDIAFRICPITRKDAEAMLSELKGKAILEGARGIKLNTKALIDAMVRLSELPERVKNLEELDINPFILNEKGGKAVDARVVLKESDS